MLNLTGKIQSLLIFKITVLGILTLFFYGPFNLSESPVVAQKNNESIHEQKKNQANVDKNEKARKSFISDLLELPPLNTQEATKADIGKYIDIATRKDRQLTERLDLLRKREEQLRNLEKSIEEKIVTLDEERRFFAQSLQQEKNLKNERTNELVLLYAKMEPKKAAPIFEKLDRDLVVELFKQLPQKQVTAVLEAMTPERSVTLSEYYGRVRSAREYDLLKEMNQSLLKEFDDCRGMPSPDSAFNKP